MAWLPGVFVTEALATCTTSIGTALGMDDGIHRHHLIIDPPTGAGFGERAVTLADTAWLPGDTVTSSTAVSIAVVPTSSGTPAASP